MAFLTGLDACIPETFADPPSVFGADILSIGVAPVTNYTVDVISAYRFVQPSIAANNLSFCNVTVTYTHTGVNDTVTVETWLPTDDWNDRLYSVGGGGFAAGRFFLSYANMAGALAEGYATSTTDGGLGTHLDPQDASLWALLGSGNLDLHTLQNFGSVSLNDQAIIAKELIAAFYGRSPLYSYWNGCSQGGRQGLMLAQRYPDAYDGIAAGAPALELPKFISSIYWPQQYMNMIKKYPYGCEIDAITQATISACDGLDGVMDGLIEDIPTCLARFDPFTQVGRTINCSQTGEIKEISRAAASVVNATWTGPSSRTGRRSWYGFNPGSDLIGQLPYQVATAATNCSTEIGCVGQPNSLSTQWLKLFVAKNPDFEIGSLTHAEFDAMFNAGHQELGSFFSTNDPDLSRFKEAGGKMMTFHGLNDNLIPPQGTEAYYQAVSALIPDVQAFYRYYEVPGLGHCFGGGGQPTAIFEQLRAWVENGTAPESSPVRFTAKGQDWNRILCPYPQKAYLKEGCGEVTAQECWSCTTMTPSSRDLLFSDL